ncbi:tetratricopeptide repeat protein [Marinagarivorans algicola]|uniref:tetratricopeptide repeat protein n=1 Tax=Marinagarivorans algicola TaxID=1513270 RepID=UPI0006B97445|nr:hypothetical protein [Marinagarivorans algicola]
MTNIPTTQAVLLSILLGITSFSFAQASEVKSTGVNAGAIDQLLVGLRKRLEQEPNDTNGWVLLAKSYHHLDRWHEAEKAAAKARALGYEGDIFPGERSIAPSSHVKGHTQAGSMVSSFFEQQDVNENEKEASAPQTTSNK